MMMADRSLLFGTQRTLKSTCCRSRRQPSKHRDRLYPDLQLAMIIQHFFEAIKELFVSFNPQSCGTCPAAVPDGTRQVSPCQSVSANNRA